MVIRSVTVVKPVLPMVPPSDIVKLVSLFVGDHVERVRLAEIVHKSNAKRIKSDLGVRYR